jgi:hypothetical protein
LFAGVLVDKIRKESNRNLRDSNPTQPLGGCHFMTSLRKSRNKLQQFRNKNAATIEEFFYVSSVKICGYTESAFTVASKPATSATFSVCAD